MFLQIKPDTSVIFDPHQIEFYETKKHQLNAKITAFDADDNQYWLKWNNIQDYSHIDYQHPDQIQLHKKSYLKPHLATTCYLCQQPLADDDQNYYIPGRTHVPSNKNLRQLCNDCAQQLVDLTTIQPLIDNITFQDWGFPFQQVPQNGKSYVIDENLIDECQHCHKLGPIDAFQDHLCPNCSKLSQGDDNCDQN